MRAWLRAMRGAHGPNFDVEMVMAREEKTNSGDGASFLGLMPLPALNPMNYWAPSRTAMLLSLKNAQAALEAWRASSDCLRAMMRKQQDEMLALFAAEADAGEDAKEVQRGDDDKDRDRQAAASMFVQPMLEATRAYGQVGKAFITAQRDTMRAFARETEQRH
jgi:hypothetical protein